jgi:low affinity Fe/Cu permease
MTNRITKTFDRLSEWIADSLGKPLAFALALTSILIWAAWGPFAHFSDTWQLIVNTSTTISTFLMVFLLQNTQNRDTEESQKVLKDLCEQQKTILDQQRRIAERLTEIHLSLDK